MEHTIWSVPFKSPDEDSRDSIFAELVIKEIDLGFRLIMDREKTFEEKYDEIQAKLQAEIRKIMSNIGQTENGRERLRIMQENLNATNGRPLPFMTEPAMMMLLENIPRENSD